MADLVYLNSDEFGHKVAAFIHDEICDVVDRIKALAIERQAMPSVDEVVALAGCSREVLVAAAALLDSNAIARGEPSNSWIFGIPIDIAAVVHSDPQTGITNFAFKHGPADEGQMLA